MQITDVRIRKVEKEGKMKAWYLSQSMMNLSYMISK